MFHEVDPLLGPEMRSTGEVLGLSNGFGEAFYKAQEATQVRLPLEGTVLFSVNSASKAELPEVAKVFDECGFKLVATGRSYETIKATGIPVEKINKMQEGRPNIADAIMNGDIQLVVNTPADENKVFDDSYIRKTSVKKKIPYITTMAAAKATAAGIKAVRENGKLSVKSLQELHAAITEK